MSAYYNEIDAYAAQWLRNLIAANLIAPGDVDERSIRDVKPDDLRGYTQCHFFAGIGGWSHAARLAGWSDDRPLWTGSCPCQPFSVAGRGQGVEDERHLWPDFYRLIRGSRPVVVMGEQVAGTAGYAWLDGVLVDLEAEAYTGRAVDIPACSVNSPQIRSRLYWVACAEGEQRKWNGKTRRGRTRFANSGRESVLVATSENHGNTDASGRGNAIARSAGKRIDSSQSERLGSGMASSDDSGLALGSRADGQRGTVRQEGQAAGARGVGDGGLGGADPSGRVEHAKFHSAASQRATDRGTRRQHAGGLGRSGYWDDWELIGPDPEGKYRRIKSGITPLDTRLPGDVGQIRGYGNAICPELAAEVMRAWMETQP